MAPTLTGHGPRRPSPAPAARALWPGDSAVGRRIPVAAGDEVEVVGGVGDVRLQSLAREPDLTLYRPFTDVPGSRAAVAALLLAVAALASWVPACRAARTDPVAALKAE